MNKLIGVITKDVFRVLKLDKSHKKEIFIGDSNIEHIKHKHLGDFERYGTQIADIIKYPTFVARNVKKDSIEYIKKYKIAEDYVLVAIRVSRKL